VVDILTTGLSGLLASQRALAVTSHNIANSATEGYSRQRVNFSAIPGQRNTIVSSIHLSIGRGVGVEGIERVYDDFLAGQVLTASSSLANAETLNGFVGLAGRVMTDDSNGLQSSVEGFFGSLSDAAAHPAELPERRVVLERGRALAERFQQVDSRLRDLADGAAQGVRQTVDSINSTVASIAALNREIGMVSSDSTFPPNDILDKRDGLIRDLSEAVSIQTSAQEDGSVSVFLSSGQSLVTGGSARQLEAFADNADPSRPAVRFVGQTGAGLEPQSFGGELGAYLEFQNETLESFRGQLGALAAGFALAVNEQHRSGMSLDGQPGQDLFTLGQPTVLTNAQNTGSAELSVTHEDGSLLSDSGYDVTFTGSQYEIVRLSDGQRTTFSGAGTVDVDGLQFSVSSGVPAAGDQFRVYGVRDTVREMSMRPVDPSQLAFALPVTAEASLANGGTGAIAELSISDPTDVNMRNSVRIVFTAPDTFDVIDDTQGSTLLTGQTYVEGEAISANGWDVVINGDPSSGDVFALGDNVGATGDNRNALLLTDLEQTATVWGGTVSLESSFSNLVSTVGATGERIEFSRQVREDILVQSKSQYDAVSGVNLDEEAASLLRYQQSYESAAEIIRVSNQLFQTILQSVRG